MKTLVLGCNGQLGQALADTAPDNAEFIGIDLPELDITSANALLEFGRQVKPAMIMRCMGMMRI